MTEYTYNYKKTSKTKVKEHLKEDFIDVDSLFYIIPENYRGLTKQTCIDCGIKICILGNTTITQITHISLNKEVSYKYGFRPSKIFIWKDKQEETSMYMLYKCTDFTRPLFITEGIEDTATLHQLGYQSCSLHSATTVKENLETDLDYILQFPEIYLCLDTDKIGKKAELEIINILKNKKILKKVNLLPLKDANDYLISKDPLYTLKELKEKIESAEEIKPEGIIFGNEVEWKELYTPLPEGTKTPFIKVNKMIPGGMFVGNFWIFIGGVSIGKSTILRKLSAYYRENNKKVGNIYVEESKKVSQLNYVCEYLGYPIGDVLVNPTIIPEEEFKQACTILFDNNSMFINEYWERTTDNLLSTMEYLATVKKYDIIILDHITAVINNSKIGSAGKVATIDTLAEKIFDLCNKTGVCCVAAAHLNMPRDGLNWDEGRKPSMYNIRDSKSLAGKPDVILGFSRNMKDPQNSNILTLEVLKNRWFSELGEADRLFYIQNTGRLK